MKLVTEYEPYENTNIDGPGCGVAEHGDDCLCDVDLEAHPVEQKNVFGDTHHYVVDTFMPGKKLVLADLALFAAELLGLHRLLVASGWQPLRSERISDLQSKFWVKQNKPGSKGRLHYTAEVKGLMREGLSIQQIAALLDVSELEVCKSLTRIDYSVEQLLAVEARLVVGADSYGQVAEETGVSRYVVQDLAKAMGTKTKNAVRMKAGGGSKYGPQVYAEVLKLHDEGHGPTEIGRRTGIKPAVVAKMTKRRGARP